MNLGLIPSSEDGWPVACRLLKRTTGGVLHIHQNVTSALPNTAVIPAIGDATQRVSGKKADREAWQAWADDTANCIASLLKDVTGASWVTSIQHIEHVKSYAPHVHHIVLDLECRPTWVDADVQHFPEQPNTLFDYFICHFSCCSVFIKLYLSRAGSLSTNAVFLKKRPSTHSCKNNPKRHYNHSLICWPLDNSGGLRCLAPEHLIVVVYSHNFTPDSHQCVLVITLNTQTYKSPILWLVLLQDSLFSMNLKVNLYKKCKWNMDII